MYRAGNDRELLGDLHAAHLSVCRGTSGHGLDLDLGDARFGAFDLQFSVRERRRGGDPQLVHVGLRHFGALVGQVRRSLPEELVEREHLLYADFSRQAGRAFDLHQQLVGIDRSGAHILAVVAEYHAVFGAADDIGVDVVYGGQEHRFELVHRVMPAFGQRVGESQRGDARYVGAGHRGALHVAVVGSVGAEFCG